MIFVTVGTQLPFDRLARAVDEWCAKNPGAEAFGQLHDPGPAGFRPSHFPWRASLVPAEYEARFAAARLVVAHAGMGSIITALTLCKPIVIMPRRAGLGEQRNDHQLATAERFRGRGSIHVAMDAGEVGPILDRLSRAGAVSTTAAAPPFADAGLVAAVRNAILGRRGAG